MTSGGSQSLPSLFDLLGDAFQKFLRGVEQSMLLLGGMVCPHIALYLTHDAFAFGMGGQAPYVENSFAGILLNPAFWAVVIYTPYSIWWHRFVLLERRAVREVFVIFFSRAGISYLAAMIGLYFLVELFYLVLTQIEYFLPLDLVNSKLYLTTLYPLGVGVAHIVPFLAAAGLAGFLVSRAVGEETGFREFWGKMGRARWLGVWFQLVVLALCAIPVLFISVLGVGVVTVHVFVVALGFLSASLWSIAQTFIYRAVQNDECRVSC